jgi:hypothetical protein
VRVRIRDVEHRSERERPMRGGIQQRIKNLAVGSRAAGEFLSVPARDAMKVGRRGRSGLRFERSRNGPEPEGRRQKAEGLPAGLLPLPSALCLSYADLGVFRGR